MFCYAESVFSNACIELLLLQCLRWCPCRSSSWIDGSCITGTLLSSQIFHQYVQSLHYFLLFSSPFDWLVPHWSEWWTISCPPHPQSQLGSYRIRRTPHIWYCISGESVRKMRGFCRQGIGYCLLLTPSPLALSHELCTNESNIARRIICSRSEVQYRWILSWLANMMREYLYVRGNLLGWVGFIRWTALFLIFILSTLQNFYQFIDSIQHFFSHLCINTAIFSLNPQY